MIFDLHNDLMTFDIKLNQKKEFLAQELARVKGIVLVYWTSARGIKPVKDRIKKYKNVFYAIEDLGYIKPELYEELVDFSPLYCSLTWNNDNNLAGGSSGGGRLTESGKEVVALLQASDIVLDTAHLNRTSFYEVIDRTDRVINSHTCLDSILPHERNLTDKQIKLIIEKGGIIGLTLVPSFMSRNLADANDYFIQVDSFVQKFGADNVAIGTDFFGTGSLPEGLKCYNDFSAFEYSLINAGYSMETIEKIFYKNAMDYFGLGGKMK